MPKTTAKQRAGALKAAASPTTPAEPPPPPPPPTPVEMKALRPVPHALYTEGHAPNGRVPRGGAFVAPSRQVADDLAAAGYAKDA